MPAQVLSLFQRLRSRDWTQNELAQFYRVEGALVQAGLQLETDRGLTDEGDPWFVFCRQDNGDVFIHFARIDGAYIAVGAALEQVVHGKDFSALVEEMLAAQAFAMARSRKHSNIFMHPAALLIAIVGGAFFHSSHAKAAEAGDHVRSEMKRHILPALAPGAGSGPTAVLDPAETATILSGVLSTLNDPARLVWADTLGPQVSIASAALPALPAAAPPPNPILSAGNGSSADLTHVLAISVSSATQHFDMGQFHPSVLSSGGLFVPMATTGLVVDQTVVAGWVASVQTVVSTTSNAVGAPPNVIILVQTSASDAAQALQAANVLTDAQDGPQAASFVLAPALKGLLDHGAHVVVVTPVVDSATPTAPASGSATLIDQTATPPATPVVSPPVVSQPIDWASSPTPPPMAPADPQAVTPVVRTDLSAYSPQVTAAIQHFSAEVGVLDVANAAHGSVVLYDGALFANPSAIPALDSITFTFSDGSSISLVGTPVEIQNLHLA